MARDYEAGTGRYVESDPIGLAAGTNTYGGYAEQRPVDIIDALGLLSACCKTGQQQVLAEPKNKDADGTVMCCHGKRESCVWSEPGVGVPPGSTIHRCKLEHEDEHWDNAPCPCGCNDDCTGFRFKCGVHGLKK
jgi:hypothetical protein